MKNKILSVTLAFAMAVTIAQLPAQEKAFASEIDILVRKGEL
jgi:hypothetical protein